MANMPAIAKEKLVKINKLLTNLDAQITAALPRHMTPERMIRIAYSAVQRQPLLLECSEQSLALSVINSSELGLETNLLGEAYLVPYYNRKKGGYECQLIPGYKGLMKLARQSGMVKSYQVAAVRKGDLFEYELGSNRYLKHVPKPDNEDAPVTHVWCGANVEGDFEFLVMTIGEINKIKNKSNSRNKEGKLVGPWIDHEEEMQKKTVLRRFHKILPASSEMAKAITLDERAEAGLPQASDLVDLGDAEEVNPNDTGAGAKAKAKLGIAKAPVEAPPARPSAEFDSWYASLAEDAQGAYTAVYESERNNGASVDDSHATAFDAISNAK